VLAGAIAFALVRTGAIGGSGSDNTANPSTGTPAVILVTNPPTGSPSPPPTASPGPGPPITSPVDVPIMMYHIIGPPDQPANDALAVSTDDFKAQMSYLACAGYTPITMQRLFDVFDGKASLPDKPIILTFDDGWAGQYTYGFPVLQQHGFAGSFAIVTGFVDAGGPYATWAQIADMSGAGMEMMSHTVSHIDLGSADDATDIDQLQTSKAALQAHCAARNREPGRRVLRPGRRTHDRGRLRGGHRRGAPACRCAGVRAARSATVGPPDRRRLDAGWRTRRQDARPDEPRPAV